jgi:hypothetical protein
VLYIARVDIRPLRSGRYSGSKGEYIGRCMYDNEGLKMGVQNA